MKRVKRMKINKITESLDKLVSEKLNVDEDGYANTGTLRDRVLMDYGPLSIMGKERPFNFRIMGYNRFGYIYRYFANPERPQTLKEIVFKKHIELYRRQEKLKKKDIREKNKKAWALRRYKTDGFFR